MSGGTPPTYAMMGMYAADGTPGAGPDGGNDAKAKAIHRRDPAVAVDDEGTDTDVDMRHDAPEAAPGAGSGAGAGAGAGSAAAATGPGGGSPRLALGANRAAAAVRFLYSGFVPDFASRIAAWSLKAFGVVPDAVAGLPYQPWEQQSRVLAQMLDAIAACPPATRAALTTELKSIMKHKTESCNVCHKTKRVGNLIYSSRHGKKSFLQDETFCNFHGVVCCKSCQRWTKRQCKQYLDGACWASMQRPEERCRVSAQIRKHATGVAAVRLPVFSDEQLGKVMQSLLDSLTSSCRDVWAAFNASDDRTRRTDLSEPAFRAFVQAHTTATGKSHYDHVAAYLNNPVRLWNWVCTLHGVAPVYRAPRRQPQAQLVAASMKPAAMTVTLGAKGGPPPPPLCLFAVDGPHSARDTLSESLKKADHPLRKAAPGSSASPTEDDEEMVAVDDEQWFQLVSWQSSRQHRADFAVAAFIVDHTDDGLEIPTSARRLAIVRKGKGSVRIPPQQAVASSRGTSRRSMALRQMVEKVRFARPPSCSSHQCKVAYEPVLLREGASYTLLVVSARWADLQSVDCGDDATALERLGRQRVGTHRLMQRMVLSC